MQNLQKIVTLVLIRFYPITLTTKVKSSKAGTIDSTDYMLSCYCEQLVLSINFKGVSDVTDFFNEHSNCTDYLKTIILKQVFLVLGSVVIFLSNYIIKVPLVSPDCNRFADFLPKTWRRHYQTLGHYQVELLLLVHQHRPHNPLSRSIHVGNRPNSNATCSRP